MPTLKSENAMTRRKSLRKPGKVSWSCPDLPRNTSDSDTTIVCVIPMYESNWGHHTRLRKLLQGYDVI